MNTTLVVLFSAKGEFSTPQNPKHTVNTNDLDINKIIKNEEKSTYNGIH